MRKRIIFHKKNWTGITQFVFVILAFAFAQFNYTPQQKRPASDETEVKAVFLFNFAQFVEWPQSNLPQDSTIVIGVLGKDPFGKYLDETVAHEIVNGHHLRVERYESIQRIGDCHILFINPSRSIKIDDVLNKVKGKNILTVSDETGFSKRGGMIHFITENKRIRLRVNLRSVKESKISISSKLLSLAEIVN